MEISSEDATNRVRLSLLSLYISTLCIRASAYMLIGVLVSSEFITLSDIQRGLIIPIFAISELATVLGFGTLCDTLGRKPILTLAHTIVTSAGVIFIFAHDFILMILPMVLVGVGAAAQVSSSLSTISDHSKIHNRARLMAGYDVLTMGGLAGGYIASILLTRGLGLSFNTVFCLASLLSFGSGCIVLVLMIETRHPDTVKMRASQMVSHVLSQRDMHVLLPVYIPVISIYGMVLSFTRTLIEKHNIQVEQDTLILLALLGGGLVMSMLLSGYLSDRTKTRRPFIIAGLICFGALATTLILNAEDIHQLYSIWPVILILALGAGAFPPAVLGYLSDISKRETRGVTFGIYSLIFGTGMIIGPILGGVCLEYYGSIGFITLMFVFVGISCTAAYWIKDNVS